MKRLSVIVPVYNSEAWLSKTLDSLVNQTYSNIEIICVDDGSQDNSCEIIKSYQKNYSCIELFLQTNSGVCAARNKGIENAQGDYIAFVDSDDYVEKNMYEKLISQMENESSDIIFCEFTRFWKDGHIQNTIETSFSKLVSNPKDIKYFFYSTNSLCNDGVLFTRDIHGSVCRSVFKNSIMKERNIRFHNELKFAEDQVFMLEYLENCEKVSYTDISFVWYRGWTKKRRYGKLYENQMSLEEYQEQIVNRNSFYSLKEKKQLIGYLKCSAYFAIVNDEFTLNPNCVKKMQEYSKNKRFKSLLTLESFKWKYIVKPDPKKIILLVLLKLRMWRIIKFFYPKKYY